MNRVMVGFRVDPVVKDKIDTLANTLGVSQSVAVEKLMRAIDMDATGQVTGTLDLPVHIEQKELPLPQTA